MNRFCRQYLTMRWDSSSLCFPLIYPPLEYIQLIPLFVLPIINFYRSRHWVTTHPKNSKFFPKHFEKLRKTPSVPRLLLFFIFVWAFLAYSSVIFPSVLTSSSDRFGILCTNYHVHSLQSSAFFFFFIQCLIEFANFNAYFFFITDFFSLVCYTFFRVLARKTSCLHCKSILTLFHLPISIWLWNVAAHLPFSCFWFQCIGNCFWSNLH